MKTVTNFMEQAFAAEEMMRNAPEVLPSFVYRNADGTLEKTVLFRGQIESRPVTVRRVQDSLEYVIHLNVGEGVRDYDGIPHVYLRSDEG